MFSKCSFNLLTLTTDALATDCFKDNEDISVQRSDATT